MLISVTRQHKVKKDDERKNYKDQEAEIKNKKIQNIFHACILLKCLYLPWNHPTHTPKRGTLNMNTRVRGRDVMC